MHIHIIVHDIDFNTSPRPIRPISDFLILIYHLRVVCRDGLHLTVWIRRSVFGCSFPRSLNPMMRERILENQEMETKRKGSGYVNECSEEVMRSLRSHQGIVYMGEQTTAIRLSERC